MDKFLTFLADKRAKAVERRDRANEEIADVDRSEKMYRASGAAKEIQVDAPTAPPAPRRNPFPWPDPPVTATPQFGTELPGFNKTIKQRVLQLLSVNPGGLTSGQILNNLNIDGGVNVSRESLSPQLSRLKTETEIDLANGVWKRVQKNESQSG
jgi:hypothetical protein